ncbi:MAG: enoyl-CoA hydratase [Acidimicrobiales bacterium]|nr:MAG: enoyl-CoA hydratase [Acidimicrobiales bacterium]
MSELLVSNEGAVRLLTLNRPDKLNAYNVALHSALLKAIDEADNDPGVRVIVVTGAGRVFCAGADFEEGFDTFAATDAVDMIDGVKRDLGGVLNLRTHESDTPIIAAINGSAVGVGDTMTIPMDIRIASNRAKFSFPFARRGIVFDGAASYFLPRLVGFAKAQEWILKADLFSAEEALAGGFMSELTEPENVLPRAMELAQDIALNCSPTSVANNKKLLRESMAGNGPVAAHAMESKMLAKAFVSPDCAEGVQAFLEKRAPNFEDRAPK